MNFPRLFKYIVSLEIYNKGLCIIFWEISSDQTSDIEDLTWQAGIPYK